MCLFITVLVLFKNRYVGGALMSVSSRIDILSQSCHMKKNPLLYCFWEYYCTSMVRDLGSSYRSTYRFAFSLSFTGDLKQDTVFLSIMCFESFVRRTKNLTA